MSNALQKSQLDAFKRYLEWKDDKNPEWETLMAVRHSSRGFNLPLLPYSIWPPLQDDVVMEMQPASLFPPDGLKLTDKASYIAAVSKFNGTGIQYKASLLSLFFAPSSPPLIRTPPSRT